MQLSPSPSVPSVPPVPQKEKAFPASERLFPMNGHYDEGASS
ncbi:hypothetical protein HMPREF1985_00605 [Mitsuokella sp. oral taxon 131 str. W9106]|nr:hypothetical protein HMPREF1985_00605 [Mitsuokella sp. oral taxon 131 str. W9106]